MWLDFTFYFHKYIHSRRAHVMCIPFYLQQDKWRIGSFTGALQKVQYLIEIKKKEFHFKLTENKF